MSLAQLISEVESTHRKVDHTDLMESEEFAKLTPKCRMVITAMVSRDEEGAFEIAHSIVKDEGVDAVENLILTMTDLSKVSENFKALLNRIAWDNHYIDFLDRGGVAGNLLKTDLEEDKQAFFSWLTHRHPALSTGVECEVVFYANGSSEQFAFDCESDFLRDKFMEYDLWKACVVSTGSDLEHEREMARVRGDKYIRPMSAILKATTTGLTLTIL